MNTIFYQNRTGCQRRYLPHDLPAWSAVLYYFVLWRQDGLDQRIQELLRCQVREEARRLETLSVVIIDTQSVRAAPGVPKTTTGLDASKKVSGRKRGVAVDVLGLIVGVVVLSGSDHDNTAGTALADQGFKDEVLIHGALMDVDASRSYAATPRTRARASSRSPGDGSWSRSTARCSTAAWPASTTTGPTPPPRVSAGPPSRTRPAASPHPPRLARHSRTGRLNVVELLADLQARCDETKARTDELRDQVAHLTSVLTETEARLADLATTKKVITACVPPGTEPETPETNTAYQTIVSLQPALRPSIQSP
ncbi:MULTISPECIES: transposase [Streptomyces]|uniref:Uncharacterized protein n=1 Tax=Streptomyces turgidiscabies (strain Car8) TaxID=698760 RepID=L7ET16_STRT8|nr:hypothetical protein STRTUCAR8_00198 [Streptomyces turgidiscabies Car8]GAQ75107.1 hypothetical protein T45_06888 [Streptomyces turgidiscabies]